MDTIIVIMMLLCPVPQKTQKTNRFTAQFEQADSAFCQKYKIDMDALRDASKRAVRTAAIKTRMEREKALKNWKILNHEPCILPRLPMVLYKND